MLDRRTLLLAGVASTALAATGRRVEAEKMTTATDTPVDWRKVTDREWYKRLTQAQYGALTILAEQHGITLSGAARHALDRYFSGFKNEKGQTLLEVAAEATPSAAFLDYLRELQREANEAKEHTT